MKDFSSRFNFEGMVSGSEESETAGKQVINSRGVNISRAEYIDQETCVLFENIKAERSIDKRKGVIRS